MKLQAIKGKVIIQEIQKDEKSNLLINEEEKGIKKGTIVTIYQNNELGLKDGDEVCYHTNGQLKIDEGDNIYLIGENNLLYKIIK